MTDSFRPLDRETPIFLPASLQEWLPEQHLARFVVDIVDQKTRYGIDLNSCSGPRDLLAAELAMLKCLVEAGRAAMQRWCKQLGDGYVGARASRGEVRYRFVDRRQKTLHGLFGLITLVRAYYAPLDGAGKGWVPLAQSNWVSRAGTRLGVSTSWHSMVPKTPTRGA